MNHLEAEIKGMPTRTDLLVSYIARERAFKGIGDVRAAALGKRFGTNLREAILSIDEDVIHIVGEVPAITAATVMSIREAETVFLKWLDDLQVNVSEAKAIRLSRAWGTKGIRSIQQNAYLLLAIADWKVIDDIALASGIEDGDMRRDVAALEAVLMSKACLARGSTRLPIQKAKNQAEMLLKRPVSPDAINAAVMSKAAVRAFDKMQPPGAAYMEAECALLLAKLETAAPVAGITSPDRLHSSLALYEANKPFPLTQMQREAIQKSHSHRLMVLAGYAGSGKTTVLRGVCETLEATGRKPLIVTLSGRAAKRASETTGRRAITIARFLHDEEKSSSLLSRKTALIVDEASMLGLLEMWRILRRLGDASLLLCGDPAQLPPINPGIVFHGLAADKNVPKVILDRVHRQDEATGIPALAEGVRSGHLRKLPEFVGTAPGTSFTECSIEGLPETLLKLGRTLANTGTARNDVQIIAPTNREIDAINRYFHQLCLKNGASQCLSMDHLAEGEPVLWSRNVPERNLTNGSMGRILSANDDSLLVELDGEQYLMPPEDGPSLNLAYAISVHKAQGSQWKRVIVPIFPSQILDRSLIYTALTRAQEQVVFIGSRDALENAVAGPSSAGTRDTGFADWFDLARRKICEF
ncbi:exodeoxyribonuclease V alpha subunit [Sulfitobacter litoralis]|uniref:Exodeoxyribonuclease V alpha subunit n=1 Tax=Sulfitobacter litoralis TaxID=335975 RepID=A0ABY0RRV0_9RHOB|nr:AAA family ATPase [Sulfitobacter litoralis]SDO40597.1 exodeoxyribonuclease V alpha subunit [Sulfitobacter litoralis]